MNPVRLTVPWLLLALAGCGRPASPESAIAHLPPLRVPVTTVRMEAVPMLTEIAGTVRPVQHALIACKVMGAIEDIPVTLGQRVQAGDVLVRIAAGEIAARVQQAQAQLNQARRDLERERALLAKGASTPDLVKNLEDRFAMTQAMAREAQVMLGYTIVRAPFAGTVARKMVNPGDLAAPGMPLLDLEGVGDYQVEVGIPDSLAAHLAVGAALNVEVPAAGARFTGTLVELSSAADPFTHTVTAKISVPAGQAVASGQYARLQIPGAPSRALYAPAAAVTTLGQMERVFVVGEGNRAVLRLVKTGATRDDRIEILSGLTDGERVVGDPPATLEEGRRLEITP